MKSVRLFPFLLLSVLVSAQTGGFESNRPLFVENVHVSGTRSLDTTQLNEIVGPLNQMKVGGTEEIRERLRYQFQEHGYFDAEVKSLTTKPVDPLASPPTVDVEAAVNEGPRFRFGNVEFTGNHALSSEKLRGGFPIRPGEFFSRSNVGKGLEALRKEYEKFGYIDFYCIPDTTKSAEKVGLRIELHEGDQFRMGALLFAGNSDLADQLRPLWKLNEGKPYDADYLAEFVKENESLFPRNFDLSNSTKITRDCNSKTVTVFIQLGPNHPSVRVPNDVGCENKSEKAPQ